MTALNGDLLYTKDWKKGKTNTLRNRRRWRYEKQNKFYLCLCLFVCTFIYYMYVLFIASMCFKFIIIIYCYCLCTITHSWSRQIAGLLLLILINKFGWQRLLHACMYKPFVDWWLQDFRLWLTDNSLSGRNRSQSTEGLWSDDRIGMIKPCVNLTFIYINFIF